MRLLKFLARHKWSFPLSILACLCFLQLAWEVRERELGPFDQAVASWLQSERGSWDSVMLALTHAGGQRGMTIVCVAAVLALVVMKQRKAAAFTTVCGIGALLLTFGLKLLFQRARPEAAVQYLIQTPSSFSFPSGHALGTTSVVGCLVVVAFVLPMPLPRVCRLAVTGSALAFIVGVAVSRVYFGVHYPSDVLGGQLAGASWVAAATGWFYPRLLPGETSAAAEQGRG